MSLRGRIVAMSAAAAIAAAVSAAPPATTPTPKDLSAEVPGTSHEVPGTSREVPGTSADGPEGAIPEHPRRLVFAEPALRFPAAEGRRYPLPGGATAFIVPDPALPLVDLALALPAGSRLDPPGQAGLAYLTAALMRRGGAGDFEAAAFDDRVEALALELDTFARIDRSGVVLSAPSWHLEPALELFCALLDRPRFDPDRLSEVETRLGALMPSRLDDPAALAEREWTRLVFGEGAPRSRDLTPASLEKIDRRDLVELHARHWRRDEMVLAVSGDVEPAGFVELWRRHCEVSGGGLEGEETSPNRVEVGAREAARAPPARPGLYHLERDLPQTTVYLGHRLAPLPWDDRDRPGLRLLGEVLGGGGAVARIAGRLRGVEGLVYEVAALLDLERVRGGALRVTFAADSRSTGRALALAIAELERLRREPVSALELQTARREVLEPLRRAFDSAENIAGHLAEDELLARPPALRQRLPEALAALTPAGLKRLARRHLAAELVIVVAGPWREIRAGARADGVDLERLGGRVVHLPARDPVTLRTAGDGSR